MCLSLDIHTSLFLTCVRVNVCHGCDNVGVMHNNVCVMHNNVCVMHPSAAR